MSILASPLPETVRIGEASVPIRSGYRTGIQVARTIDSDLPAEVIAGVVLRLYFGDDQPDPEGAIPAAFEFHRGGKPPGKRKARARLIDWDHDAGMILADFRREYGVDLADPTTRMHWWVFLAYFQHLSGDSETKTAMTYRGSPRPKNLKGEDARRFDQMKKAYALPPRSKAEAAAREAAMWGDSQ